MGVSDQVHPFILERRCKMSEYEKVLECYILYVEYKQSLREVAKNLMVSHQTVKDRLERLSYINDEMYQAYIKERGLKKRGPKKKQNI